MQEKSKNEKASNVKQYYLNNLPKNAEFYMIIDNGKTYKVTAQVQELIEYIEGGERCDCRYE